MYSYHTYVHTHKYIYNTIHKYMSMYLRTYMCIISTYMYQIKKYIQIFRIVRKGTVLGDSGDENRHKPRQKK